MRPLQTVTLPILVDAQSPEDAEGWIGIPTGGGHSVRSVRLATPRDGARPSAKEKSMRDTISELRTAIIDRDIERLKRAVETSAKKSSSGGTLSFAWSGKSPTQILEAARWEYSMLVSVSLEGIQTVIWTPGNGRKRPRLALYCPPGSSSAIMQTMASQTRFCANEKCRAPFTPSSAGQKYHAPSCGIAVRTRRSRANAK